MCNMNILPPPPFFGFLAPFPPVLSGLLCLYSFFTSSGVPKRHKRALWNVPSAVVARVLMPIFSGGLRLPA